MPDSHESKQASPEKGLDALQLLFLLAMVMGGFMFVRTPTVNTAQLVFRVAVFVIGVVGLLVVSTIKFNRRRAR